MQLQQKGANRLSGTKHRRTLTPASTRNCGHFNLYFRRDLRGFDDTWNTPGRDPVSSISSAAADQLL